MAFSCADRVKKCSLGAEEAEGACHLMVDPHPPWRQQPLGSLATRIIAIVFVATFVTALVVSGISVHATYTFLRSTLQHTYPRLLAERGTALERWMQQELQQLAQHPPASRARLLARLHASRAFDALIILDPRGAIVRQVGHLDSQPAPPVLPLTATPVLRPLGNGKVAALIPLGQSLPPSWLVGLFSPAAIEARLSSSTFPPGLRLRLAAPEAAPTGAGSDGFWLQQLPSGSFEVRARTPLPALGATLLLQEPFDEAFAPVFAVVARAFVVDLGILLFFSLLAYRITNAIVRPIEALSDAARQVSQGERQVELPEPAGNDEISLLSRTFNDMTRELDRQRRELEGAYGQLVSQNLALQRANEVLEQLSITDGLTKLHNHRYFQDHLTSELKRVGRSGTPISMLLMDIDDFKQMNDRQGHAAGDELLVRLAGILNDAIRDTDLLARYGGEEFVVLAINTDLPGAVYLAEKMRTAVAETSFILSDSLQLTRITVSIGVATYRGSRKAFFQEADQALYRAKDAGKNCVVAFEPEPPSPGAEAPDRHDA